MEAILCFVNDQRLCVEIKNNTIEISIDEGNLNLTSISMQKIRVYEAITIIMIVTGKESVMLG